MSPKMCTFAPEKDNYVVTISYDGLLYHTRRKFSVYMKGRKEHIVSNISFFV